MTLAQWFSPAFPVGAFSYSHGLEAAIDSGEVCCPKSVESWIRDLIYHGGGRNDALFIAAAFRASDTEALSHVNAQCRAFAASKERLMETDLQGEAFCAAIFALSGTGPDRLAYPVSIGWAASDHGLPLGETLACYLQAFASNLVAVAMRLVPIGQSDGQRIIQALSPDCLSVAQDALSGDLDDLSSICFMADIASMRHETQHSRIFRS